MPRDVTKWEVPQVVYDTLHDLLHAQSHGKVNEPFGRNNGLVFVSAQGEHVIVPAKTCRHCGKANP